MPRHGRRLQDREGDERRHPHQVLEAVFAEGSVKLYIFSVAAGMLLVVAVMASVGIDLVLP